jgi:hypothetical protein
MTESLAALARPAFIDLIFAAMLIEATLLALLWRRTGRGVAPGALAANLLAGSGLLLALRLALAAGGAASWIPLCLLLALAGHVADLALRWQPGRGAPAAALRRS